MSVARTMSTTSVLISLSDRNNDKLQIKLARKTVGEICKEITIYSVVNGINLVRQFRRISQRNSFIWFESK